MRGACRFDGVVPCGDSSHRRAGIPINLASHIGKYVRSRDEGGEPRICRSARFGTWDPTIASHFRVRRKVAVNRGFDVLLRIVQMTIRVARIARLAGVGAGEGKAICRSSRRGDMEGPAAVDSAVVSTDQEVHSTRLRPCRHATHIRDVTAAATQVQKEEREQAFATMPLRPHRSITSSLLVLSFGVTRCWGNQSVHTTLACVQRRPRARRKYSEHRGSAREVGGAPKESCAPTRCGAAGGWVGVWHGPIPVERER